MLKIRLIPECTERIRRALERAGIQEIGGVLVGEHVGPNSFDVIDASVQTFDGSAATFVRSSTAHLKFMEDFRRRHADNHARFNYLGEWHSHPSFSLHPSSVDVAAMKALIEDPDQLARFAVLMIVKLDRKGRLRAQATCHQRGAPVDSVTVLLDGGDTPFGKTCAAIRAWFRR